VKWESNQQRTGECLQEERRQEVARGEGDNGKMRRSEDCEKAKESEQWVEGRRT
jgi:hypothetical protein